jgi:hypothetical protein
MEMIAFLYNLSERQLEMNGNLSATYFFGLAVD